MASTPRESGHDGAASRRAEVGVERWRERAVRMVSRLIPGDVLWYVDTDAAVFGLTFDDGPSPDTTPALLDVLARHRGRATFFLIGERVRAHPDLVAAIAGAGHEVAN